MRRRNAPVQKDNQRRHDTPNDMPPKKGVSLGRVCLELHGRSLGHRDQHLEHKCTANVMRRFNGMQQTCLEKTEGRKVFSVPVQMRFG